MSDSKKTPWMAGLFAGIFSSSDGTWVPMSQLRRFSSVGAWMIFFLGSGYGVLRLGGSSEKAFHYSPEVLGWIWIFVLAIAIVSFLAFLWIGALSFGVEEPTRKD